MSIVQRTVNPVSRINVNWGTRQDDTAGPTTNLVMGADKPSEYSRDDMMAALEKVSGKSPAYEARATGTAVDRFPGEDPPHKK